MGAEPVLLSVPGSTRLHQPHQLCLLPLYTAGIYIYIHTLPPSPPLFLFHTLLHTHTHFLYPPLSMIEAQEASPLFAHRK